MGLDQFAYKAKPNTPREEWIETCVWRKHANLEGYMASKYSQLNTGRIFSSEYLQLSEADILELLDCHHTLPKASGFFWGDTDEYNIEKTQAWLEEALADIADGWEIWYYSWW